MRGDVIYSRLLWCRGGPDPWYNMGGPAKRVACKSSLFTESSLVVKIKNTWLILLSNYHLLTKDFVNYQRIVNETVFSQIVGMSKCCGQNGDS